MASRRARIAGGTAAVVAVITVVGGGTHYYDSRAKQETIAQINQKLASVGWRGTKDVQIFRLEGVKGTYLVSNLPVVDGCTLALAINQNGQLAVEGLFLPGGWEPAGAKMPDGRWLMEVLYKMRHPTRDKVVKLVHDSGVVPC